MADKFAPRKFIEDVKQEVLLDILDALESLDEVYVSDVVHEVVDTAVGRLDRVEEIQVIDYTGNEDSADSGLIDSSSLNRFLATMAYACTEQELWNDDFFQELQGGLNNEHLSESKAKEIAAKIREHLKE